MKKDLDYYRALPYTRRVDLVQEEDGERYYVAYFLELEGCIATGETRPEAVANLKGAFDEYVLALLDWKTPIPEPEASTRRDRGRRVPEWTGPDLEAQGFPTKELDGEMVAGVTVG